MITLKYTFIAEFKDGSSYVQTLEDKSLTDEKRSAFYDIQDREDLIRFSLTDENGYTLYGVDLRDGYFDVKEKRFWIGEEISWIEPLRLVYFRRHRHKFNAGDLKEESHEIRYFIGWQTTVDGKNEKRLLSID